MYRITLFILFLLLCNNIVAQNTEYTIPVVVHVVHNYGTENIPDQEILDAINNWDSVFNAKNADTADVIQPFKKYIGNAHIHLKLATKTPDGNPTKGIVRNFSYLYEKAGDQAKIGQWPPDRYLNVWVFKSFDNYPFNVGGFAYRPAQAATMPYYDGIKLLGGYVVAKTAEQCIGRYLDLLYVWGETYDPGIYCGDDGIDDTPPTKGHDGAGCTYSNLFDTACASGYLKHYLDAQNLDSVVDYPDTVNAQNIMDEAFCSRMFTIGQCEHMRATLNSNVAGRANLISQSNLIATGALDATPDLLPVPEFSVEKGKVAGIPPAERTYFYCAKDSALQFAFVNRSWNDTITKVHWHFSNGAAQPDIIDSTALSATKYNLFSQPGWVTVSLTASGNNSGDATFTDMQAVYAADGDDPIVEDPTTLPLHSVEFTTADTAKWPVFNYYKNNFRWEYNNSTGFYDHSCMQYCAFDTRQFPYNTTGSPKGDYDDFFSQAYDLSAMQAGYCNLNFMSAGASRVNDPALMTDTFEVSYSIDCGRKWASLVKYSGTEISNNTSLSIAYAPLWMGEWKLNSIELPAAARTSKVFFRFRYRPGADANGYSTGNNYYLDRISISNFPTGVNTLLHGDNDVALAPNPTNGPSYLVFNSKTGGDAAITIVNVTGQAIYNTTASINGGDNRIDIPSENFKSGMYFITITTPDQRFTKKLVVCEK